jgi:hypothetical protein
MLWDPLAVAEQQIIALIVFFAKLPSLSQMESIHSGE